MEEKFIDVGTGVEVGKMAYGTGEIPFIRTTDIVELEIKSDPRQGVSREIYEDYRGKAGILENDILLVRDGTYLVGSSAIALSTDLPAIFCGGIYRVRALSSCINPFSLIGLLNLPIVRRQMRAKQFTRDVIDTLGKRLFEVEIPDPRSGFSKMLGSSLEELMKDKNRNRDRMKALISRIEPTISGKPRIRPGWSMRG